MADPSDLRGRATRRELAESLYIRASSLFDARYYLDQIDDPAAEADPALHYLLKGEAQGAAASAAFRALDYVELNPDLKRSNVNRLLHFEVFGRAEGRRVEFESDRLPLDDLRIDPGKPTVLLLLHEATYTGAPILGWNLARELKLTRNVVVVLRRGGALAPALATAATAVVEPPSPQVADNPAELGRLAARLKQTYDPLYVIANSTETRLFGVALREQGVPLVALVHEFATNAPPYAFSALYKACDAIVFPAEVVRQSSLDHYDYGLIAQRNTVILPQGPSAVPRLRASREPPAEAGAEEPKTDLRQALDAPDAPFTVVGLGAVDLRKGVDLFIAAATTLKARHPDLRFRFIWVGDRVHPLPHPYYSMLDEQIARSGLEDELILCGAMDDLEPIYAAADAYFLSSRLDPLPNVGIDAALRGVPILCFREATGFADLLAQQPATAWLVAPYMDTATVAESLALLIRDPARREAASRAVRAMARRRFNMVRYAAALDDLGCEAASRRHARSAQAPPLLPPDAFDARLYFGPLAEAPAPRETAVQRYLQDTLNVHFGGPAVWGHHPRRPLPGFHPLMYGRLAPGFDSTAAIDPLVDFIRKGRPSGPWAHAVIRLAEDSERETAGPLRLKAAVHGHFHYTDNFGDFLDALDVNAHPLDLILTTTGQEQADVLETMSSERYRRGRVTIHTAPNIGRDIAPFVSVLEAYGDQYDVMGHLHGKRSTHTFHYDPELGNRWRHFLWQHLVGPAAPVADIILEQFAQDPELGIVFPENDHLVGWEKNRGLAETLAARLGLEALPEHVEFPVGTMFWARPAALRPLVDARFAPEDYPPEPLPIDGTMLHALERMLPLVAEAAGFRYMTTYFPQFTR